MNEAKRLVDWKAHRTLMRADYEKSKETLPKLAEFLKLERDRLDTDPLTLESVISVRLSPLELTVHRAASSIYHAPRPLVLSVDLEAGVKVRYSEQKAMRCDGIVKDGAGFKLVSRDSNGTPSHAEFLDVWNAWLAEALTHESEAADEGPVYEDSAGLISSI